MQNSIIEKVNIIRESRKALKIVITQEGKVFAYIPLKMPLNKVQEILNEKADWIEKKTSQITRVLKNNQTVITYKQAMICGNLYDIVSSDAGKKITVLNNTMQIPQKHFSDNNYVDAIKKWYKSLAKEVVLKRAYELQKFFNIKCKDIKTGDFKAKWGSCDNNKIIKLNFRLVMLPHDIIDYVILHEFAHIYEMNHSAHFYAVLDRFLPSWKKCRLLLKENNYLLNIYR